MEIIERDELNRLDKIHSSKRMATVRCARKAGYHNCQDCYDVRTCTMIRECREAMDNLVAYRRSVFDA